MTRGLTALATALCGLAVGGCAASTLQAAIVGNKTCKGGPVVYLIVDTSGSTKGQRGPGGPYEQAAMKVVRETARRCGSLFAAPVDGNGVAYSQWKIDGRTFQQAFGGNTQLNATARVRRAADQLRPQIRSLLNDHAVAGSDILGALDRVALTTDTDGSTHERLLVLLSDGALLVKGRYDVYRTPLATQEQRDAFIRKLRSEGEIPDLGRFDGMYLSGIGIGMRGRTTALGTIKLWQRGLVTAMGTRLRSADSTLRFP